MRRRTPEDIERLIAEHGRLWLLIGITTLGLLILFSLGDWTWLSQ